VSEETEEDQEEEPLEEEEEEAPEPLAEEEVEEEPLPELAEEDFVPIEEKIYTVPLGHVRSGRGYRRTPRAVRALKDFIVKHMKADDLTLTPDVNEKLWSRGIRSPPREIRVRAARNEEDEVRVYLA
jgi:large subunit ribosomal protein L31e